MAPAPALVSITGKQAPVCQDELDLIRELQSGNSAAFGDLVGPHRRKLMWVVRRIVPDPVDADDVLQDALIRIYRAIGSFRGDACLYTWMFRITYNCALAFSARSQRDLGSVVAAEPDWSDGDSLENVVYGSQMVATVDAALASMRPEFKTAMMLHQFDGLSYHQISTIMLCPVGTVRSRISTARDVIASKLRQRGFLGQGLAGTA